MKRITIAIFALILITSCNKSAEKSNNNSESNTVQTKESTQIELEKKEKKEEMDDDRPAEGTEVKGDTRLAHLSNETTTSDGYIVDSFVDMDITYVTVDFITYTLNESPENEGIEVYDIVNNNPKLRTFIVKEQYKNCGGDRDVSIKELVDKSKKNKKTVFSFDISEGLVTELYIDICSG